MKILGIQVPEGHELVHDFADYLARSAGWSIGFAAGGAIGMAPGAVWGGRIGVTIGPTVIESTALAFYDLFVDDENARRFTKATWTNDDWMDYLRRKATTEMNPQSRFKQHDGILVAAVYGHNPAPILKFAMTPIATMDTVQHLTPLPECKKGYHREGLMCIKDAVHS